MFKKTVWFTLLAVLLLASFALAKEWWEEKSYSSWSQKDVDRMLDRSPWGKVHSIVIMNPTAPSEGRGARSFTNIGRGDLEREKQNHFHLRFLTAKPVRMALARGMRLDDPEKANRAGVERFIGQSNDRHIVLALQLSATPEGSSSFRGYWRSLLKLRTTELTNNTLLATKTGKRVYLTHYQPPGEDGMGAKFYFPRTLPDGRPLVTTDDREIRFETTITLMEETATRGHSADIEANPRQEHSRTDRIWMKFDLRKMVFEGKIEI